MDLHLHGSGRCFRCGAEFPEGGIRYRIDIRVSQDTGEELAAIEDLQKELKYLMDVIENKDTKELERELHEEFRFYLCKACRDEYVKGPDLPLDTFFFGDGLEGGH